MFHRAFAVYLFENIADISTATPIAYSINFLTDHCESDPWDTQVVYRRIFKRTALCLMSKETPIGLYQHQRLSVSCPRSGSLRFGLLCNTFQGIHDLIVLVYGSRSWNHSFLKPEPIQQCFRGSNVAYPFMGIIYFFLFLSNLTTLPSVSFKCPTDSLFISLCEKLAQYSSNATPSSSFKRVIQSWFYCCEVAWL